MTKVELTDFEIKVCTMVGKARNNYGTEKGLPTDCKQPEEIHILGCIGEYAVCKHLGFYWDYAIGSIDKNDIKHAPIKTDVKTAGNHLYNMCSVGMACAEEKYNGFEFIFTSYEKNEVRILGKIKASLFFKLATRHEGPNKDTPYKALHKKHLTPFKKPRS